MTRRTHYEVMMLDPTATPEVVSAVYRVLAKQYHPDHAGPEAAGKMALLNEAYAILGNEQRRAKYDEQLGLREPVTTTAKPNGSNGRGAAANGADGPVATAEPSPAFRRESAPGATNLKFEAGQWTIRPPDEPTPSSEFGEAGRPPAYLPKRGTTISFGRYRGWTVNQVAAYDRTYVEWLSRTMAGRTYRIELEQALAQSA